MAKWINFIGVFFFLITSCSGKSEYEEEGLGDYNGEIELATFAGGCFWCIEAPFEDLDGVVSVVSGYSGGKEKNPSYAEVSSGKTGHKEAIQIAFNPNVISYSELVDIFLETI